MSKIYAVKKFTVKGVPLSFVAGIKNGFPIVVFGMKSPKASAIDTVMLDMPFPSLEQAIEYVNAVTEDMAKEKMMSFKDDENYMTILNVFNKDTYTPDRDLLLQQSKKGKRWNI